MENKRHLRQENINNYDFHFEIGSRLCILIWKGKPWKLNSAGIF